MKRIILSPWTALLTLALVLSVRIVDPGFVESIRLRYFDTLIASKPNTENNIYTVNIDEASLNQYGQWPLPRAEYAKIIKNLYERHAGLVVLDVLMPEPDRTGGDNVLGKSLKKFKVVLPNFPAPNSKNKPHPPGSAVVGSNNLDMMITYPGLVANLPIIEDSAAGVGVVNTLPEIDGVNRRIPLVVRVDNQLYPSLALETLRVATNNSTFQVKMSELGVEKMRLPGDIGIIATDNLSRIWIDWSQQNKRVSLIDLPTDFNNAIVIVGPTAAGIANPVPSSIGSIWPQDLQASLMATMINHVVIQRPVWADTAEILTLAVLGVILIFLTKWTYVGIIFGIVSIFGTIASSHYLFIQNLWLGDCVYISGALIIVMLHSYTVKFVAEYLAKLQIKKQFGSYVNPTIVERLQKNPELIKLGGERKELSIVMTDLRGFTALGESFGDDVEGLTQIMNDYMTALSVPVFKNDGTLIKFIGDASLHVHGAPLDDVNHAKTAVRTALDMIKAIDEFNIELTAKGRPPVGMGAGVNTGETLIGNIGSKTKFGYDVLGDSVSTAARLEGQTKGYGVLLIIGPKTAELIRDEIPVFELDCIAVKGKTIGLKIYTSVEDSVGHRDFLKHYYAGDWNRALQMIEYCKKQHPDMAKYYDVMTLRLKAGKPTNWAGVYHATSK